MQFVTEAFADLAARITPRDIPPAVTDHAALLVLDCIASAIGGAPTANAASIRLTASRVFGCGATAPWFSDLGTAPAGALLGNCAAASALDIDDGHRGASGHAGAAIIPAVLTMGAGQDWSGAELLTAITLGYDVALRVASARRPGTFRSYAAGQWCGYGVAAALGRLYGLAADGIAHAIAIAGAESPQNLPQGACRMSSVKGSSPWGTFTALVAVERAVAGGTGSVDLLDRSDAFDQTKMLAELGQEWFITATYIKPYASCRYTHAAIDAVLALVGDDPDPSVPIDALTVEVFPECLTITNDRVPTTSEAAQFSLPFSVALAALRGARALRPLSEASLTDSEVLALSRRVEFYPIEAFAGAFPQTIPARVRLRRRGVEATRTVVHARGDVENPLGQADVEAKLADLARGILPSTAVAAIVDGVAQLKEGSPAGLYRALSHPALRIFGSAAQ